MKGSLKKRGDIYYAIVYVKNSKGETKQKWISTKCNKKVDAEKVLRDIMVKIDNQNFINPVKISFAKFLDDWLNNVAYNKIEYTTFKSYKMQLDKHILPYFIEKGNIKLQDLQPFHIERYYQDKLKEGLSANTVLKHHANITNALKYAVKMNLIPYNPANRVELPKKHKFIGNFYNSSQIEKLLRSAKDTSIETPVILTVYYGLHRGEVLGLKWDAIDFEEETITIEETRVKAANEIITKLPKNSSSIRTLPLLGKVKKYLIKLKNQQDTYKKVYAENYDDSGFVCCHANGEPISPSILNHRFRELLKRSDLPHIRFHDLRHSTASFLLSLGFNMKAIQDWLGHSVISTTMDIYSHLTNADRRKMASKIEDTFMLNSDEDISPE